MARDGSYTFWNSLTVVWTYNSAKQELTVTGTLNGKNIGTVVLTPGHKTGQLQGTDSGNTGTVGLLANFNTAELTMNASETQPSRSGTQTTNF